jgi:hypothetical protein
MERGPIEIDLTGPDGNVFVLMAYANNFAKQIWGDDFTEEAEDKMLRDITFDNAMSEGLAELYDVMEGMEKEEEYTPSKRAKSMGKYITNQMMESDYENAVAVFDKYFGSFVTLYR